MAGLPLGPAAPPDRRAAAVDHRRPQVGERVTLIGEHVPALVHRSEDVLDDVFPCGLVTDDEGGRSAVSSGAYLSAPGLMPTTLHAPVIGCLRPLRSSGSHRAGPVQR